MLAVTVNDAKNLGGHFVHRLIGVDRYQPMLSVKVLDDRQREEAESGCYRAVHR